MDQTVPPTVAAQPDRAAERYQINGVSIAASTLGPSSWSHPAIVAAVVVTITAAAAIVTTVIATGTMSLRAFPRGLRTRRAYHRARELAQHSTNATSIAAGDTAFSRWNLQAASMSSAV